jgi:hypothetical protein
MPLVIIGGHSRNIGKTSLVAGLIFALPECQWTAVKITQFGHGICSQTHEPCDCAHLDSDHTWSLDEEHDRSGASDSSRFLVAGAAHSYWLRTRQGMLAEALPDLRRIMGSATNIIIESNSLLRFVRPDLYIPVLDPATADFKDSAREFLDRADAVAIHASPLEPQWDNVSLKLLAGKPQFSISPPAYINDDLVKFVRERISQPVLPD